MPVPPNPSSHIATGEAVEAMRMLRERREMHENARKDIDAFEAGLKRRRLDVQVSIGDRRNGLLHELDAALQDTLGRLDREESSLVAPLQGLRANLSDHLHQVGHAATALERSINVGGVQLELALRECDRLLGMPPPERLSQRGFGDFGMIAEDFFSLTLQSSKMTKAQLEMVTEKLITDRDAQLARQEDEAMVRLRQVESELEEYKKRLHEVQTLGTNLNPNPNPNPDWRSRR